MEHNLGWLYAQCLTSTANCYITDAFKETKKASSRSQLKFERSSEMFSLFGCILSKSMSIVGMK